MGRALKGFFLAMLLFSGSASAAGKVRLVVMDGINLEHLDSKPLVNFRFLLSRGAVGLANANTAGGRTAANAAVTLGAGSRALAPGAGIVLHSSSDHLEASAAGEAHARRTGVLPPPGSLVVPSIARITEANAELSYTVRVGYLADTLTAAGKTTAALVNADGEEMERSAAVIVADGNGIIMGGEVGKELFRPEPMQPFGIQSDLAKFTNFLAEHYETDFLVIDLGDSSRAQEYAAFALEDMLPDFRFQALLQLDQLLGELLRQHNKDDLLLVVGLQGDRRLGAEEGKWLVPVLAYGEGFSPGLLTSPTTRRLGIVASFDVTAAILEHFGLYRPGEIHGQPLTSHSHPAPFSYLRNREEHMAGIYLLRTPLIKGYIGIIIILVGLSVAALLWKWQRLGWLRLALAAVTASPLVLLVLGALPSTVWLVPLWIILAFGSAYALRRLQPAIAMGTLGALTAAAVVIDGLFGAWLQQRSILGYDAIAGARYYGIGNEFMGVLLGSTLLATRGLLTRRKGLAALIFAGVALLLMLPGIGANFGGTLAALVGFTSALTGFSVFTNKKYRRLAVLIGVGAAVALVLLNLGNGQSHVGRFFSAVASDPAEFWLAVQRKLAMSWRLLRWSLWSKAFAALFVAAIWMMLTHRRALAKRFGPNWPGVRGAMAAALAALLFNDSGVVAAATTLLYLTLPQLYYEFSSSSWVRDSHSP